MNTQLQNILSSHQRIENLSAEKRLALQKSLLTADKVNYILEFMPNRLEKANRTTSSEIIAKILKPLKTILSKVQEDGNMVNGIEKLILQHSRGGSGKKEPTNQNTLLKETINLVIHGIGVGKNLVKVDFKLDLDPEFQLVSLIKEDFTRVIINLRNNAFDAMRMNTDAENNNVETQNGASPQTPKTISKPIIEDAENNNVETQNVASPQTPKTISKPIIEDDENNNVETEHFASLRIPKTSKNQIPLEPKLTVRTKKPKDKIIIEIEDNGPGIPDDIKDKILQPFFTTKPPGQGTGLGLSLSYDIVKAYGGELSVASNENKGATFLITIPT